MRGSTVPVIAQILVDNFSFNLVKATAIVEQIRQTPLQAQPSTQNLSSATSRREWMMMTLDKLARLSSTPYAIDAVPTPSTQAFIERYYATNTAVKTY